MAQPIQRHRSHLYSVYFAPRGLRRMTALGMQIAQEYLDPFDQLIGIIGEAGSGKSMLVRGMFPGLELTNDDDGVNIRPLPLLDIHPGPFGSAHTYHVDIRFESAFTQMHVLADAILGALAQKKRVIVEHFELIYPLIARNANLLIGVGKEVIITRPSIFGPEPGDVAQIVFQSIRYRKMAHTAEDLVELCLQHQYGRDDYSHGDIRYGFTLGFAQCPAIDVMALERQVLDMIADDLPVSYCDEDHVLIGTVRHPCTGPRMHAQSTGEIEGFSLVHDLPLDPISGTYLLAGLVGGRSAEDINRFHMDD